MADLDLGFCQPSGNVWVNNLSCDTRLSASSETPRPAEDPGLARQRCVIPIVPSRNFWPTEPMITWKLVLHYRVFAGLFQINSHWNKWANNKQTYFTIMFTLNLSRTIHNKSNGSIKFYLTQNVEFTSHIGANFYFIKIILISNKNIKPSICRPMLIFNCSYVFSFLDELIENKLPFRMSFYLDKDFIRSSR